MESTKPKDFRRSPPVDDCIVDVGDDYWSQGYRPDVSQTSDDSSDQGFQNRIAELEKQMETLRIAKTGGVEPSNSVNKPGKSETIVGNVPKRCFGCNGIGHFIANCPRKTTCKTVVDQIKAIRCDFCGKLGHSLRVCWKYRDEQKGLSSNLCLLWWNGSFYD